MITEVRHIGKLGEALLYLTIGRAYKVVSWGTQGRPDITGVDIDAELYDSEYPPFTLINDRGGEDEWYFHPNDFEETEVSKLKRIIKIYE